MSDGINASSEHLPFMPLNEASAKRAVAELTLLREMLGKADAHALVVISPRTNASIARKAAMKRGATPEDVALAQAEVAGYGLAELMLTERIRFGEEALTWAPREPKALRRPSGGQESSDWRVQGEAALRLTETAGWDILVRRWADMAWTAAWLKSVCPPSVAPILDAQIKGILGTVILVQQKIDKLHAAVAWQQEQAAKD